MHSPVTPLPGNPPAPRPTTEELLAESVKRTIEALKKTEMASDDEIATALNSASAAFQNNRPVELLEWVARAQGFEEETIGPRILLLSDALASTMSPSPALVPFAGKLITPLAFYETYHTLRKTAAALMTPVVYAEDTDAIGVASINPLSALILSEEIETTIAQRTGITPFLTVARMDYESWAFLTRKHFGL